MGIIHNRGHEGSRMSGSLEDLVGLVPPPECEVTCPPWHLAREQVGFDFPGDYREFVDRYGGGSLTSNGVVTSMGVMTPVSGSSFPGKLDGFAGFVDAMVSEARSRFDWTELRESGPERRIYPLLPDPGGLLLWGDTDAGDCFFWSTDDADPSRWPIIIWQRHDGDVMRFDGGFVEFLVALLAGEHVLSQFLVGTEPRWTMDCDWARRGLQVSAGPARRTDS